MTTTTKERTLTADDTFARLLTAGADSLAVRKANPGRYWAHRGEGEPAAHYFWEEVPVSRAEYVAATGENLRE